MDPTPSLEGYWSLLKAVVDNKKIPCIPLTYHNNNYITDLKEKAQIFNNFFDKQCTLVENTSKLPIGFFKRTNNFFQLSHLLKMVLLKSLKALIQIKLMTLT